MKYDNISKNFYYSTGCKIRKLVQSVYCKSFFRVGSFDLTNVPQNINNYSHLSAI